MYNKDIIYTTNLSDKIFNLSKKLFIRHGNVQSSDGKYFDP